MKRKKYLFYGLFVLISVFLISGLSFAQEKLKLEDYKIQLAEWQRREAEAKAKIASLQKEIDALNEQIAAVQAEIDQVQGEIYTLVGSDKEGVDRFRNDLKALDNQIDGLAALEPEELFRKKGEIDEIESKIAEAKKSKISVLTEMQDLIATLEGKLAQLKGKVPASIYDMYTVIKGDYLWKISSKEEIYGDPYQWMKIYTFNRDQIKNPDLIYPDQIFKILRGVGPNEYIVVKGDWLAKIAGYANVYEDPTKWTKLYEANKEVISDPNLIYPHQVLVVPKD